MVRVVSTIVIVLLVLAALGAICWFFKRRNDKKQRDLALYVPDLLADSPVKDLLIERGRQLAAAREILRGLAQDSNVFLPDSHHDAIAKWLEKQGKDPV